MGRKTRLANKTQWALQDVVCELKAAHAAAQGLQKRNEQKFMDPITSIYLQRLVDALARIEVTVVRAQHGEYGNGIEPVDDETDGAA